MVDKVLINAFELLNMCTKEKLAMATEQISLNHLFLFMRGRVRLLPLVDVGNLALVLPGITVLPQHR